MKSLYEISINTIQGKPIQLNDYKNKYTLFVNVASKCGFTPQYKDLETLYKQYEQKLMIIGLPCNQFGSQEPGSSNEIASFCEANYGVSFVITEKVAVKGPHQHPLYKWLTSRELNNKKSSKVRWNFQKYLVDPKGKLIDYYYSITSPLSNKITKHIK